MKTFSLAVAAASLCFAPHSSAQAPQFHFAGSSATPDAFGFAVGGGEDLTGDGVPDLLVGSPTALNAAGTEIAGAVDVYSGADGSLVRRIRGNPLGGALGTAVTMLGDVTGDGLAEIVAGSSYSKTAGGALAPGYVSVYNGATGALLHTTVGVAVGDRFGTSLDSIGDLNADGNDDIVVGALGTTTLSYVAVLSGASGSTILSISTPTATVGDSFGWDVSSIGTVNGGALDDIVVSAPHDSVYVFSGSNGSLLYSITDAAADAFGYYADAIDDVDSDGIPDIALSAGVDNTAYDGERVWLCSGVDGSLIAEWLEPNGYCDSVYLSYGVSIEGVGDWDGDGKPEVAVGASQWDDSMGIVLVQSTADGSIVDAFWGEEPCDGAGLFNGLANVGDLNGDAMDDVFVGSYITSGSIGSASCPASLPGYANAYLGGQGILTTPTLSVLDASGESQVLEIDAGAALGNQYYWVLGSTSGTHPGTTASGATMPLNSVLPGTSTPDPYFDLTLNNPSGTPLNNPVGTLSAAGKATVTFTLPSAIHWPGNPFVAHAVAVFDSVGAVLAVSNPIPLGIRGTTCP